VVLYDPDDQVAGANDRPPVTAEQIREWAFESWCALADAGKYLRRRSSWEALDRINTARARLWELWAVAMQVSQPEYGLTSLLDFAPEQLPPGIERTACDLDPARQLAAARQLAQLLSEVGSLLPADQRAALPADMASYISKDLAEIELR